jgi:hypothetical protein
MLGLAISTGIQKAQSPGIVTCYMIGLFKGDATTPESLLWGGGESEKL